jgi:hypothetical protein
MPDFTELLWTMSGRSRRSRLASLSVSEIARSGRRPGGALSSAGVSLTAECAYPADVRRLFLGAWIDRKGTLKRIVAWERLVAERSKFRPARQASKTTSRRALTSAISLVWR